MLIEKFGSSSKLKRGILEGTGLNQPGVFSASYCLEARVSIEPLQNVLNMVVDRRFAYK